MKLEFISRKLKKESECYSQFVKNEADNNFIVIGEEQVENYGDCFNVHQIESERGLILLGGLRLDEFAFMVLKDDFETIGNPYDICELDIPKDRLSLDLIDEIQRLNGDNEPMKGQMIL